MDEYWLLSQVEPSRRIERVGVGPDDLPDIRARELGNVSELIDRLRAASCFQKHQRISVNVGSFCDIVGEVSGGVLSMERGSDQKRYHEGSHKRLALAADRLVPEPRTARLGNHNLRPLRVV